MKEHIYLCNLDKPLLITNVVSDGAGDDGRVDFLQIQHIL